MKQLKIDPNAPLPPKAVNLGEDIMCVTYTDLGTPSDGSHDALGRPHARRKSDSESACRASSHPDDPSQIQYKKQPPANAPLRTDELETTELLRRNCEYFFRKWNELEKIVEKLQLENTELQGLRDRVAELEKEEHREYAAGLEYAAQRMQEMYDNYRQHSSFPSRGDYHALQNEFAAKARTIRIGL